MKLVGAISTAVLTLSLGLGIPAYAQEQHDQKEENKDKPSAEKEKKAQSEKSAKPEEKNAVRQGQDQSAKPEEKNAREQHTQQARPEQQGQHAGNHGGSRIPADRYKANFGRDHRFRVTEANYRDRRFQYGGYSFGFVDAWPSNWLYTQEVFVVEIDGVYYLCNASYPGVNLALSINL